MDDFYGFWWWLTLWLCQNSYVYVGFWWWIFDGFLMVDFDVDGFWWWLNGDLNGYTYGFIDGL
jgi:hypothetical protein